MLNYLSVKIVIWSFLVRVESLVVFLYFLGENIKARKRYLELKDVCQHMFMEIAEKKWEKSFSPFSPSTAHPPPAALQKTQSSNLISVIQLMLRAAVFQEVLLGAIVNEM